MKRLPKLAALALALLSTLNPQLSTCRAQGSLTPPGAPAPTMKSLAQIEPRTAITNNGLVTISNLGSYYLAQNISISSGTGITIDADNVTLDLTGFNIRSSQPSANNNAAIAIINTHSNITILNGNLSGGVVNNGGTYTGKGFGYGITASATTRNVRVSGVSVSGCFYNGIALGAANATTVQFCTVDTVGGRGIVAEAVTDATARQCGDTGIFALRVSNGTGECVASGDGIYAGIAQNCYGSSGSGNGVYATNSAINCYGSSSGGGYGLYAGATAENCRGRSSSGTGLYSGEAASNCCGVSDTGHGLFTGVATGCRGNTSGNLNGLTAYSAQNCEGLSFTGAGLSAGYIAIGCRGVSSFGPGLYAILANSCLGSGSPAVDASYKFDMP
jgi:hypothetical protein